MPVNTPPDAVALPRSVTANDVVIRTAVSTTPLFANIADRLLRTVADAGQAVVVTAGETVFRQGDAGDQLYCVLSGYAVILELMRATAPIRLLEA